MCGAFMTVSERVTCDGSVIASEPVMYVTCVIASVTASEQATRVMYVMAPDSMSRVTCVTVSMAVSEPGDMFDGL